MQSTIRVLLVVSVAVCATYATPKVADFGYAVNDPITGDHKSQQESRVGDAVSGFYKTLDADGLMRTVNYRADPLTGFNAVVDRSPAAIAPIASAAIAPIATPGMVAAMPAALNIASAPILRAAPYSSAAVASHQFHYQSAPIMSVNPLVKSAALLSDAAPAVMAAPMWQSAYPSAARVLAAPALSALSPITAAGWTEPIIKK